MTSLGVIGALVGREDDAQVGAVGDAEVLQPEEVRAVRAAVDGRLTAALVEAIGVLELARLDLHGRGARGHHRDRHRLRNIVVELGHGRHGLFHRFAGHLPWNFGVEGEGELLDHGLAGEQGRAQVPACHYQRAQRRGAHDGEAYPVPPDDKVPPLAEPVGRGGGRH